MSAARVGLFLPLLLLAGCESAAEKAEAEYDFIDKSISTTAADRCRAAQVVQEAWLAERDKLRYEIWSSRAALDCSPLAKD